MTLLDLLVGMDPRSPAGTTTVFELPPELVERTTTRAQGEGWAPDTLFAAAWTLAQSRWTGAEPPTLASDAARPVGAWLAAFAATRQAGAVDPSPLCVEFQRQPRAHLVLRRSAGLLGDAVALEILEAVAATADRLVQANASGLL
ncbi:MAG: hypothetical protein EOO22_16360, partial [Comamonadaceae bacterium]